MNRAGLTGIPVGAPVESSFEALLASARQPVGIDFGRLSESTEAALRAPVVLRAIGATFLSHQATFGLERITRAYDAIVYTPVVRPARAR